MGDFQSLYNSLELDLIGFFDVKTRDEALEIMAHRIFKAGFIQDETQFLESIKKREKIVSTGIGMGVAIPHAKLPLSNRFFISIGILNSAVDWNAIDKIPVKIIFMIGGPDDKQTEYLQLLSTLTKLLKDEERRQKLLLLKDPQAIVELFNQV